MGWPKVCVGLRTLGSPAAPERRLGRSHLGATRKWLGIPRRTLAINFITDTIRMLMQRESTVIGIGVA